MSHDQTSHVQQPVLAPIAKSLQHPPPLVNGQHDSAFPIQPPDGEQNAVRLKSATSTLYHHDRFRPGVTPYQSRASLATTLVRPGSTATGGSSTRSAQLPTPPDSIADNCTSRDSLSSASETRVAARSRFSAIGQSRKKSKFANFFTLKEPSASAFAQMQTQMRQDYNRRGGAVAVPTGKLPDNLPPVNSRWDGLPDRAKQKPMDSKERKEERQREKTRSESKCNVDVEPIGQITYETLDPKARGEMPALSPSTDSADASMPATPISPIRPQASVEKKRPRSSYTSRSSVQAARGRDAVAPWESAALPPLLQPPRDHSVRPVPVSRQDATPWDFMEGPPNPADKYMAATSAEPPAGKKGRRFGLFGRK